MEQLAQAQEAGYDGLFAALAKHSGKLEELMEGALAILTETHQVVTRTHGDVQDIKAALQSHGQHLEAMGQAMFRALSQPAAAPGEPARKEEDVRKEMLDTLLTTPHR